jgi:putative ABC transport system substrate-binding protein
MIRGLFAFAISGLVACLGLLNLSSAADAQQAAATRRIGVLLLARSPESEEAQVFRRALLGAGYSEGSDVVIEWRSADGDYGRVPELVADLVQSKVDVVVVESTVATQAAKRATSTIPIVMTSTADPVGSGLVANLAHPGGNVTGLTIMTTDLVGKRLQLLKDMVPRLARVAVLGNPDSPYTRKVSEELKAVAPSLSIKLNVLSARTPEQFGPAFSAISRAHAQALYVIEDSMFSIHRATILERTSKARLPAIYGQREFTDQGGLMSYGTNFGDMFRRAAGYVDKILKGAKPGDLPIEQPTRFELVVNLKTANALGITIPEAILLRADEVIR